MVGFFAFVVIVVLGILTLVGGLQWIGARREPIEAPGPAQGQLERIETALSVLESRIDELQEQQRFLERLLEARPERDALPRSGSADEAGRSAARPEERSILFDTGPDDPSGGGEGR